VPFYNLTYLTRVGSPVKAFVVGEWLEQFKAGSAIKMLAGAMEEELIKLAK
jgi:hypothetical protein